MIYRIFRCQRERQFRRQARCERESVRERQRLECRESSSHRGSETYCFSPTDFAGVLFLSINPFLQAPS